MIIGYVEDQETKTHHLEYWCGRYTLYLRVRDDNYRFPVVDRYATLEEAVSYMSGLGRMVFRRGYQV